MDYEYIKGIFIGLAMLVFPNIIKSASSNGLAHRKATGGDALKYKKLLRIGSLISGLSIIIMSVVSLFVELIPVIIACIVCTVIGLGLIIYALVKSGSSRY